MHILLLVVKIFLGSVAGLILLGFLVATVRAIVTGKIPREYTFTLTDVQKAQLQAAQEGWLHRSLVAFDIAINVIVLRGQEDETISTHSWRAAQEGKLWGKLMSDWLDLYQSDHGIQAASGDLQRAENDVKIEEKAIGQ